MHSRANTGNLLGGIASMAEYHLYPAVKRKSSISPGCTGTIRYTIGHISRVRAFIYYLRRTKNSQWRATWRKCGTRFITYAHFHYEWTFHPDHCSACSCIIYSSTSAIHDSAKTGCASNCLCKFCQYYFLRHRNSRKWTQCMPV